MSSIRYGISSGEYIPNNDLRISITRDGKTSADCSFTILKEDKTNTLILSDFVRGQSISNLRSELSSQLDYVTLTDFSFHDIPGGYCEIRANFEGIASDFGDLGNDDEEKFQEYTLTGVVIDRPVMDHPFWDDQTSGVIEAFGSLVDGTGSVSSPDSDGKRYIRNKATLDLIGGSSSLEDMIDAEPLLENWFNLIVGRKQLTYADSEFEWTVSASKKGGLEAEDLDDLGKEATPEGPVITPNGYTLGVDSWWQYINVNQTLVNDSAQYSKTWIFRKGKKEVAIFGA